jgi:hypothetical protein
VHASRARGPHGWQAQATAVRVTHTHPLAVMEPRASAPCRKRRPVNRPRYPSPRHIQQDAHRPARSRTNSANRPDCIQPSSPGKRRIQGHQMSFADRRVKDRRKFSGGGPKSCDPRWNGRLNLRPTSLRARNRLSFPSDSNSRGLRNANVSPRPVGLSPYLNTTGQNLIRKGWRKCDSICHCSGL